MALVTIDLEEGWYFWPREPEPCDATVEVSDELITRHRAVMEEYRAVTEQLEHAYRHQMGLKPYQGSPYKEVTE